MVYLVEMPEIQEHPRVISNHGGWLISKLRLMFELYKYSSFGNSQDLHKHHSISSFFLAPVL